MSDQKPTTDSIASILEKYRSDFVILDGILQWALNPTSSSAGYGIEANYPYIRDNLRATYNLTLEQVQAKVDILRCDCQKLKGDIYQLRKDIIHAIAEQHAPAFSANIHKKIQEIPVEIWNFLHLCNYLLEKGASFKEETVEIPCMGETKSETIFWPGLQALIIASFGSQITQYQLVKFGLVKKLYFKSSSGNISNKYLFIPFLDKVIAQIKLPERLVPKLDIEAYITELINTGNSDTVFGLEDLWEIFSHNKNLVEHAKGDSLSYLSSILGLLGAVPSDKGWQWFAFSVFADLEYIGKCLKRRRNERTQVETQKVREILEYEIQHSTLPPEIALVREMDISIGEAKRLLRLLTTPDDPKAGTRITVDGIAHPWYTSVLHYKFVEKTVEEVIKQLKNPTLYECIVTLGLDFDTARAVGQYLLKNNYFKAFPRILQTRLNSESTITRQITTGENQFVPPIIKPAESPVRSNPSTPEQDVVGTLKKLVSVSKSLTIDQMAKILKIDKDALYAKIVDWAVEFGFTIDREVLEFGTGNRDAFMLELDRAFQHWGNVGEKK